MPAESTIAGVGFALTVTGVDGLSTNFDCRHNVKKRIANILYLNNPPPDSVLLAYAGSQEITASNSLFIGDRSDRLYPNSRDTVNAEFIYHNSPAGVQHGNILVTAKFADSSATDMPLYFKHLLESSVQIDTIKILDKDFQDIESDQYLVEPVYEYDESNGAIVTPRNILAISVYNNLESNFDESTGEYEVYYLQYRDASNDTLTILLDNVPAYNEATINDIWGLTGELKPWSTAYIVNKTNNSYTVSVPRSNSSSDNKFAVRYTRDSKIYVEQPVLSSNTSLWIPRIANGSFSWGYGGEPYLYEIAEFTSQSFNPIEPYKLAARAQSTKIDLNLVKLPHEEIALGGVFQYFSMLIYKDNALEYALTEDPSLAGSRYKDFDGKYVTNSDGDVIEWSNTEVLSIDRRSGMVQLSIDLKDTWSYNSTYNYKERFYELASLNMNPIYNQDAHKEVKAVYIVPQSRSNGNSGTQRSSIHYVIVAPNGVIEDTSQNGEGGNPDHAFDTRLFNPDGVKISGHKGLHYNWRATTYLSDSVTIGASVSIPVESTRDFPREGWIRIQDENNKWRYMKYIDKTLGSAVSAPTLILSDDTVNEVPTSFTVTLDPSVPRIVEVVNFLDEHTNLSSRDPDLEMANYGAIGFPNSYNRYFILADMTINPPHGVNDVVLLDTRQEGGGIIPEKYEEAKQIQPEAQWYFDYIKYDGQPHPGNAAVVIKLPVELLDSFTEEQIAGIINNNIPFGVKPLIRYYGYKPRIISVDAQDDTGFGKNYFGEHHFGEE